MPPIPFPENPSHRPPKLTACITFAHGDWNIPHLQTSALQPVSKVFRLNMARVRLAMLFPAHLGDLSVSMQRLMDLAQLEMMGALDSLNITPEKLNQIHKRWEELFATHLENRTQGKYDEPEWDQEFLDSLQSNALPAEMLGSAPTVSLGLEAMLSLYLTCTWTGFETMCGDLWEAALNAHPERLAHLNGNPKRLTRGSGTRPLLAATLRPNPSPFCLIKLKGINST
jgi:hypothetical protein